MVIYDIVDDKRRTKMVHCLESFGTRVQKSAFEGFLTKTQYDKMIHKCKNFIDPKTDSLRIYIVEKFINTYSFGVDKRKKFDCIII
ncbi:CRISPR-associated endonuclease Cas2 [Megamonas hypermegale]|uniref:CRISPR-associated endonuclease Cas2 n=1 Tax=Megamonas hypermegale TaxID=158847 RepID=UPI001EF3EC4E|nr:CRISPR-associated endonuclease Cas2 [Megamonas hypermegale]